MPENDISELKLKVGLLEKDIQVESTISEKLSESIEKIQEMSLNLVKLISYHEEKHTQHEHTEKELKEDIKELHSRITTVNREIHERIDQVEHHIASRIDALRTSLEAHKRIDKIKCDDHDTELEKKVEVINQWRWQIMGAIAVISWLVGQTDIIGKLLK